MFASFVVLEVLYIMKLLINNINNIISAYDHPFLNAECSAHRSRFLIAVTFIS